MTGAALPLGGGGLPSAARRAAGAAGLALGAALLGAASALGAYVVSPWVLPALLCGAVLLLVTLRRPEVGIGAWFLMVPLGTMGSLGRPTWLVPTAWALVLLAVALTRPEARVRHGLPPVALPLLGVLALTVVESTRTPQVVDAIPIVRVLVSGLCVFFAIALLVRTREQFLWVLGSLAVAGAYVGLHAVREWRSGTSTAFITGTGELVNRASAGFGQPNALAGFLLVLVPACIALALAVRRGRGLALLAALLTVVGLYVTFSRGALIGLAVVPFAFLGLRRSLLVVPLVVLTAVSLAPDVLRERFATASLQGSEAATRVDFWRTAVAIWEDHPVAGVGPGGFPSAYATARVPGKQFLPDTQFEPPPHAHNLVLHLLAEQGVLGLAAFALVVGTAMAALARARRSRERWLQIVAASVLATLLAFLVHNMLDVTLLEGTGQVMWALFGVASAAASAAAAERGAP